MTQNGTATVEALDLTHVLYDPSSKLSLALALVTLSPILLMACYGALTIVTRDLLILNMWIGQYACEKFNSLLKHIFKEERVLSTHGDGYAFPSSHSQFMGYFATFLLLHLYSRHRFQSTGIPILDTIRQIVAFGGIVGLAGSVCFSRYFLNYHTPHQIIWGLIAGVVFGAVYFGATEYIPDVYPLSILGRARRSILQSTPFTWCRIKDGWAVWKDGGHEAEYQRWRNLWDAQNTKKS